MHTVLLQSKPRKDAGGQVSITIEALGESPLQEALKGAIGALEHHPARVSRRTIIDMLALIERFNLRIVHTEHNITDDDLESWLFILQG
jgi:hypothetical protein